MTYLRGFLNVMIDLKLFKKC